MSSVVTICNVALGHLGDTATVTSISPPDSSLQAQLCSRFYPVARLALLEMNSWGFSTVRAPLALLNLPNIAGDGLAWQFAYAVPADMINALAVQPSDALSDYQAWPVCPPPSIGQDYSYPYPQGYLPGPGAPDDVPQPYALEVNTDGTQIVLTNVCDAVMRFTVDVTDTTRFSPLFTLSLTWLLASLLAGPILKGDVGASAGEHALAMFESFRAKASMSDANQRKTRIAPSVSWVRGR